MINMNEILVNFTTKLVHIDVYNMLLQTMLVKSTKILLTLIIVYNNHCLQYCVIVNIVQCD
jgi:hypothetical protein